MYCLVIIDEKNDLSLYKIGNDVKQYSTKEDALIEISAMKAKEKELFGNVITQYKIAEYKE